MAGFGSSAAALVGAGLLVNVLLAVVARSVSVDEYALFSAFWAVSLVAGFGVFLPVEQLLAERLPASPDRGQVLAGVLRVTSGLAVVEVVVLLAVWGLFFRSLGGGWGMWAALAVLCVVSAGQFLARGYMIGTGRLHLFALVLVADAALRVVVALVLSARGAATGTPYAWAVVVGIAAAHLPVLVAVSRALPRSASGGRTPLRPVVLLLGGSLGAQLLFNGPTLALSAVASSSALGEVGTFQAAFQLVRIPLFLAVPMQATLVPVMSRLAEGAGARERVGLLARFCVAVMMLMAAGVAVGYLLGPWLVRLVFGSRYDVDPATIALLAAGVGAYLGVLVLTQVLVAEQRHATVAASWGAGAAAAVVVFVAVPDDVTAAGTAFTVGSICALVWALVAIFRQSRSHSHQSS